MATLQKIRNNAGLLVSIFIGFALLAFIMGDLLKSGSSMFSKSRTEVAEIAGKSVPIQLYQGKVDETIENYKRNTGKASVDALTMTQLQDQTWEQLLREYIMQDEYAELGIGISGQELFDMVQGNNIDPQIQQIPIFQNQETGQFDRTLVIQFLKNMELDPSGNAQTSWNAFEKALSQEKISKKYNTLIEKSLFVTSAQVKNEVVNKNLKVDFDYVALKFNTVSDSAISYTDKDINAYYAANKDKFKRDESREINYVTFVVRPTKEDEKETEKWVADMKSAFESDDNNAQFISLNSDLPYNENFYSEAELPASVKELSNAEVGTVFGPYKEDNAYKLTKVADIKNIPDSVKASHILIRPEDGIDAVAIADSLLKVAKGGANFAELAKKYSSDGSAAEGGDLGWFQSGAMVKPFSDACFFGNTGDIVVVQSQFGSHVIKIVNQSTKSKKVQLATLARNIEPSTKTYQDTYADASKFGGNNRTFTAFRDAAQKEKLGIKVASLKRSDKKVAQIENSRQLVRWVYKGEQGEVSEIFEFGDIFLIASIKNVQEEGVAPLADVKAEIEREVKKDKKADYLIAKLNEASKNASTIQIVAEKTNTVVNEAKNTTFAAYSITGLGFEPEVQGIAMTAELNKIEGPIKGKNGVYVIQVKNIVQPAENLDSSNEKNLLTRSYRSRVNYQVYEAIKEASNIEDRRSEFY
ncbi:MAG: SurA N-terminal domain-containing protein [Salinivirgaceae bacterium]|nr:SurA N-terminal domain-containing protein [Salinivirgaceae bacterium]